jgi:hypothetical protein
MKEHQFQTLKEEGNNMQNVSSPIRISSRVDQYLFHNSESAGGGVEEEECLGSGKHRTFATGQVVPRQHQPYNISLATKNIELLNALHFASYSDPDSSQSALAWAWTLLHSVVALAVAYHSGMLLF